LGVRERSWKCFSYAPQNVSLIGAFVDCDLDCSRAGLGDYVAQDQPLLRERVQSHVECTASGWRLLFAFHARELHGLEAFRHPTRHRTAPAESRSFIAARMSARPLAERVGAPTAPNKAPTQPSGLAEKRREHTLIPLTSVTPLFHSGCSKNSLTGRLPGWTCSSSTLGEDRLLYDCVDAPVTIDHLGDAEVDCDGHQRDRLVLG
jgi:hypothetical protein